MTDVKIKTIFFTDPPPPPEYEVTLRLSKEELRMLTEYVFGSCDTVSRAALDAGYIDGEKREKLRELLFSIWNKLSKQGCR